MSVALAFERPTGGCGDPLSYEAAKHRNIGHDNGNTVLDVAYNVVDIMCPVGLDLGV